MLIKDLIKKLKEFNPKANITLTTSEDITLSYICKDNKNNILTKKTTGMVFIEPTDECPTCVHEYNNGEMICSFYDKPCHEVKECYQYEEFVDYDY